MTDQELLKLAAKAAGFSSTQEAMTNIGKPVSLYSEWNPQNDPGDAMRLAVHMCFSIHHWKHSIEIEGIDDFTYRELSDGAKTRLALTCAAITNAAAEIGKAM